MQRFAIKNAAFRISSLMIGQKVKKIVEQIADKPCIRLFRKGVIKINAGVIKINAGRYNGVLKRL